jgi:hypothetical protein
MYGNSRLPASAQTGVHGHLAMLLDRHVKAPFRKPYADYNRSAFAASFERFSVPCRGAPLILDSCCGVGESSHLLARAFPNHYVIGVDQSASRLARGQAGLPSGQPISIWFAPTWSITGACCARRVSGSIAITCFIPTPGRRSAN